MNAGNVANPLVHVMPPREGYDRVAPFYDQWSWQKFWQANELPVVLQMIHSAGARRAVDVGVGTGRYLDVLGKQQIEGIGVDISPEMLRVASRRSSCAGRLQEGDVRELPLRAGHFDLVIAARILSHVPEIDRALFEIARVLRPGGYAVLTDVDGEHAYDHTRIDTPDGDVRISVVKRTLSEVLDHIHVCGCYHVIQSKQLRAGNISYLPGEHECTSIDRSNRRAIAYALLLRRIP